MIIKYAVLNPFNGQYTKVNSKEEAYNIVVQNILDFYKMHTHACDITKIQVDEEGNETWLSIDNGTELPEEYIDQIKTGVSE